MTTTYGITTTYTRKDETWTMPHSRMSDLLDALRNRAGARRDLDVRERHDGELSGITLRIAPTGERGPMVFAKIRSDGVQVNAYPGTDSRRGQHWLQHIPFMLGPRAGYTLGSTDYTDPRDAAAALIDLTDEALARVS